MINKKLAVILSAAIAISSLAACNNTDTNETTKAAKETTTVAQTDYETTSANEETTKSDETEETKNPQTEDWSYLDSLTTAQKYREIMSFSADEARSYFGVEVDATLTEEDYEKFLDKIFVDAVSENVLTINSYVADPSSVGVNADELSFDLGSAYTTLEDIKETYDETIAEIKQLLSFDTSDFTNRQKLVFDKVYYEDILSLWGSSVCPYNSPVNTDGVIQNLGIGFYEFAFRSQKDVDFYLKSLEVATPYIASIAEGVKYQADNFGYYPTDDMLNASIETINEVLTNDENVYINGFESKLDALGLDEKTAQDYKDKNQQIYEDVIVPAYKNCATELEKFLGKNTNPEGLCSYSGGRDYFEFFVQAYIGSSMNIDEVLELLDDRIEGAMKKLSAYASVNYSAIEDYLNGNYEYPVNDPDEVIRYLIKEMSGDFPDLGDVKWTASYLPKSLQIDRVLAYYILPTVDMSEVNIIRVNGSSTYPYYTTISHEGYPGHMLQFNVQKNCGTYNLEQIINELGYCEGWAMFAEYKALKYAGFSSALSNILMLDSQLGYYLSAYVDVAVNGAGYSREDIYSYLEDFGMDAETADIYYESVISSPGAILPYAVGEILVTDLIKEYIDAGNDALKAYSDYMAIGSASFEIVKKYMGTEF